MSSGHLKLITRKNEWEGYPLKLSPNQYSNTSVAYFGEGSFESNKDS